MLSCLHSFCAACHHLSRKPLPCSLRSRIREKKAVGQIRGIILQTQRSAHTRVQQAQAGCWVLCGTRVPTNAAPAGPQTQGRTSRRCEISLPQGSCQTYPCAPVQLLQHPSVGSDSQLDLRSKSRPSCPALCAPVCVGSDTDLGYRVTAGSTTKSIKQKGWFHCPYECARDY